jgi:hypothetical protein
MNIEINTCSDPEHKYRGSIYDVDKVPTNLFRRVKDNPKSDLLKYCLDCRNSSREKTNKMRKIKKDKEVPYGHFMCSCCLYIKQKCFIGKNVDGSDSKHCDSCKLKKRRKYLKLMQDQIEVKKEMMFKIKASCEKCKKIYLKPKRGETCAIEIIPKKDIVIYNNIKYKLDFFLQLIKSRLEFKIIELDHLSEKEQRKRGYLLPNEQFVKKKGCIGDMMMSRKAILLEAKKCQIVCGKCHLEETIRREKNKNIIYGALRGKKQEYANNIKKKTGCSSCKKLYPTLLRFLEFDHIVPLNKKDSISNIVQRKYYSMNDLIEECKKCRILCRHCHKIHSAFQRSKQI